MSTTTPHQPFLLADHLRLSLLERQQGIEALESQESDLGQAEDSSSDLARLRKQYKDLYAQFHGTAPASTATQRPNDPTLAEDFTAAQSRPTPSRRNKSVRFRDNPKDEAPEDPVEVANRAALFSDPNRYRDEPEGPDQSNLDNQQIHTYHKQVLRDQDEQLDTLGQSIRRQRMLGIQMGDELDEQNELLTDVESGVDRHTTTLDRARRRLGHVARKSKDNWNWVTIGILIVVLVLLIIVLN
ncbi:hypothetical protein LTR37_003196 [Vermiconidia calcicola]|uniref:Uncharacterized protein n=1 Tax=Vermiconidia calcicola TaxID=1690605 RepID=A0ACC3NRE0_9PEZI|nr:hypothetical protein LTR37_003196 [Vermiconidia calcicola]